MKWYLKLMCVFTSIFILLGTIEVSAASEQADLVTTLSQANTIKIKKSWFSFNKDYQVYVDGEKVGKVEGLYFNIFGVK